jgi:hypothetical protein
LVDDVARHLLLVEPSLKTKLLEQLINRAHTLVVVPGSFPQSCVRNTW